MQQSFNIHVCIGDQIHLYHLLSNFIAISHYSVCFYCLNSMFTKSIYCHMYVHRYGSIYWCVSSPSEPESLKNTDILLQQVSTASTSSEGAGPPLHPRWDFGGLDPVQAFCVQSQPVTEFTCYFPAGFY